MAIKKSELYSSLWQSCDELRGGMDASQYKDYILVLLFIKYVSDKFKADPRSEITVPTGASFDDMVSFKGNPEIGDLINKKIIAPLAEASNLSLAHMPDFNDSAKLGDAKEKVDRLTNLIAIFEKPELDFSKNRADGDDILGDAYEYLMRHFASESGKSKGQFYTPAEVSRIMAKILGISQTNTNASTTVYDPTCGSGSLLLRIASEARSELSLFGQEKDSSTSALAQMNMILHNNSIAEIKQGNTLANPKFITNGQLTTFDYVVANPPFSDKKWSTGVNVEHDEFGRFDVFGVPPAKQGDYAYLLHIIRSMKHNGKAACILPHGVLFRGNAEAAIRTQLLKHGYIKAIIGLPPNLFYGTGIPACIIVLDKEHAQARKGVFMIDASKGFIKDGPKNRLREQDIHLIVDTYLKQDESNPRFARLVSLEEIAQNEYNLNLPRYIDSSEAEDIQDIAGHLYGGIPAADVAQLQAYWDVCPNLKASLFAPLREGYFALTVPATEVKKTIYAHHEFEAFMAKMTTVFETWRNQTAEYLKSLPTDFKPKQVIIKLSEDLLTHYRPVALLDPYNVYQLLMDYWDGVVQDDAYLIVSDGWLAKTTRIIEIDKKTKKEKDKGWRCDLVPKELLVSQFFAEKQAELEQEKNELESLQQQLLELEEEHSGDDGLLEQGIKAKDIAELWNNEILEAASVLYANDFKSYQQNEQSLNQLQEECKLLEASQLIVENLINKGIKYSNTKQVTALAENFTDQQKNQLNNYINKQKQLSGLRKTLKSQFEDFNTKVCNKLSIAANDLPNTDNLKLLQQWQNTYEAISQAKERVKLLDAALDKMAYEFYGVLTETQIKQLVVDHKWLASLQRMIEGEVERVSQQLTQRVRELAERYAKTLPQLAQDVAMFEALVNQDLAKMGFAL